MRTRNTVLAGLLLATLVIGTACDSGGPSTTGGVGDSVSSAGEIAAQQEDLRRSTALEAARFQIGSYDYAAVEATLEGIDTPEAQQLRDQAAAGQAEAVVWEDNGTISHVFVHSLIVDPDRAFDGDHMQQGYLDYMVTLKEFEAILEQLHANDFVLVSPDDIAALDADGQMQYQDILLPPGKKPLVLSQDDVNYYEYMEQDGFAKNLVLDEDGSVTNTYIDADGEEHRGAYDVVPVVDRFVDEHPDFSYRGAKGILAVTGYNGVLGHRTSESEYPDDPDIAAKQADATEVAEALKEDGWVFASHSWGHLSMTTSGMDRMRRDTALWAAEVQPIVGQTHHLIYPFGADISRVPPYAGAKYELLQDAGFQFFYGVDTSTPHWMQRHDGYLRQARINLDGLTFDRDLAGRGFLDPFFDLDAVLDPARP